MMVIQLPLSFIGGSISQVFSQRASALRFGEEKQLSDLVKNTLLKLMVIGIFPTLVFLFLGQDLYIVLFGSQWAEAGLYTQIFAIWIFIMFITSPLSSLFAIFEQQKLILVYNIALIFFRIIVIVIGGFTGNVIFTLGLFSFVSFSGYGVGFMWLLFLSKVSLRGLLKDFTPYLLYCIPIGAIILFSKWIMHATPLCMVILTVCLGLIYFYLVLTKDEEYYSSFIELMDETKRFIKRKL
jgi:O-antigen/teichoic acid export membrane protein